MVEDTTRSLPIPQDDFENIDLPAFHAHQADIIMGVQDKLQDPPPGEFRMEDLVWTNHVTNGKGRHKDSRLVVIQWHRLDDFISGEQHHHVYPCKFNPEVIRRNLPNSLKLPHAHNPPLVVR